MLNALASPGWKFSEQEMRGIPMRIEIGPKDIEANQAILVRRDIPSFLLVFHSKHKSLIIVPVQMAYNVKSLLYPLLFYFQFADEYAFPLF